MSVGTGVFGAKLFEIVFGTVGDLEAGCRCHELCRVFKTLKTFLSKNLTT